LVIGWRSGEKPVGRGGPWPFGAIRSNRIA
jgi:hypothetical protein